MWGFAAAVIVQTAAVIGLVDPAASTRPGGPRSTPASTRCPSPPPPLVLSLADGQPFAPGGEPDWADVLIALAAAAAWFVVNYSARHRPRSGCGSAAPGGIVLRAASRTTR